MTTAVNPQQFDVIRARRFGNRAVGAYVIDRVADLQPIADGFACFAHREHGAKGRKGQTEYMVFEANSIRVIRSYR